MHDKQNITAVILAGGRSLRMGGAIKSLKKINNELMIDKIYYNLKNQVQNIIINTNDSKKYFAKFKTTIIRDEIKGYQGPLAGIHASLKYLNNNSPKNDWLITVPGDTPFIPKDLVEKLSKNSIQNKHKIVLAKSNDKIHPIIGIWHCSVFKSLELDLNSGTRKIMDWAKKHPLGYEEFVSSNYDPFFNINFESDILKAEKIEKAFF